MGIQSTKQTKVLCIEDEFFISELYKRALTKAGYDVTMELDGHRGLALARSDAFDIILLDLMLPSMTGIEILRSLRHENPDLKARIIITTNLDQSDEIRANIEQQADGYIVKANITPRELVTFLATLAI
jgi:DNA-binding response OmpR family regulator